MTCPLGNTGAPASGGWGYAPQTRAKGLATLWTPASPLRWPERFPRLSFRKVDGFSLAGPARTFQNVSFLDAGLRPGPGRVRHPAPATADFGLGLTPAQARAKGQALWTPRSPGNNSALAGAREVFRGLLATIPGTHRLHSRQLSRAGSRPSRRRAGPGDAYRISQQWHSKERQEADNPAIRRPRRTPRPAHRKVCRFDRCGLLLMSCS